MLKVVLSVLLISAILIGIYLAGNTVIRMYQNQNNLKIQINPIEKKNYQTASITKNNSSPNYTINVQYPEVITLNNTTTQEKINQLIKSQAGLYVSNFQKEVAANANPLVPKDIASNLTITFTVAQVDDNFVSFQWNVSDMQAGMAHPNNYTNVFNYSVSENKVLTLSNIFQPNSNYLNTLSQLTSPQLKTQLQRENYYFAEMFDPGIAPTAKNYQNFLLGSNSLIIIFDYYQVAPYVVGTSKVYIPYSKLQKILNPSLNLK